MKIKKKNIIIILLSTFLIVFLIEGTNYLLNNKKTLNLDKYEIANKEEYFDEISDFEIEITGSYEGKINKKTIVENKFHVYEFDGAIYNDWDTITNHYIGIKLIDLISFLKIENVTEITFKDKNYNFSLNNLTSIDIKNLEQVDKNK